MTFHTPDARPDNRRAPSAFSEPRHEPQPAFEAARRALTEAEAALRAAAHGVAAAQTALDRLEHSGTPGRVAGGTLSVLRAARAASEVAFDGSRPTSSAGAARPTVWRYAAQGLGDRGLGDRGDRGGRDGRDGRTA